MSISRIALPIVVSLMGLASAISAQEDSADSVMRGEIEFEQEIKESKTYAETEQEALDKLQALAAYTRDPSGPAPLAEFELEDDHLLYLNALYLFCSVKRGTCPEILDSIMEIDIIRSASEGAPKCLTLKRFWKSWLDNDMQRRHQYQVRTGYLRKTEEFKKKELPRYLRCTETVQSELESLDNQSSEEFLKKRYYLPSDIVEAVTDTLGTAQSVQDEKINLIHATGVRG